MRSIVSANQRKRNQRKLNNIYDHSKKLYQHCNAKNYMDFFVLQTTIFFYSLNKFFLYIFELKKIYISKIVVHTQIFFLYIFAHTKKILVYLCTHKICTHKILPLAVRSCCSRGRQGRGEFWQPDGIDLFRAPPSLVDFECGDLGEGRRRARL